MALNTYMYETITPTRQANNCLQNLFRDVFELDFETGLDFLADV